MHYHSGSPVSPRTDSDQVLRELQPKERRIWYHISNASCSRAVVARNLARRVDGRGKDRTDAGSGEGGSDPFWDERVAVQPLATGGLASPRPATLCNSADSVLLSLHLLCLVPPSPRVFNLLCLSLTLAHNAPHSHSHWHPRGQALLART